MRIGTTRVKERPVIALVPTYIWPTDDEAFQRALAGYAPGVTILTGDNSGPGAVPSPELAQRIEWLHARGWASVGYVRLDYLRRPLLDIAADVAQWRAWYPSIGGFFFDECPTMKQGALEAAKALESMARTHNTMCVFNAGAPVDDAWFNELPNSVIVTFEGTAQTYATVSAQRHARAAHLVYGATAPIVVQSGYGATTTDGEPGDANPWDADGTAAPGVSWSADRVLDLRELVPVAAGDGGGNGRHPAPPA